MREERGDGEGADSEALSLLTDTLCCYEQQIKREIQGIHICGCRFHESLKTKTDGSKSIGYTGFRGELEHLTKETNLIGGSFEW